jgi:sulfite reductase alpha subunit-like flavoprotein
MTRSLVILYGSETGCAQDVAENLGRQARRRHFKTKVMAMDDYDKVIPPLHADLLLRLMYIL